MRKLSLIFLLVSGFVLMSAKVYPDSPHGKDFKVSCNVCHSSKGWKLDKEIYSFDHSKTALPLVGQHEVIDCRSCHQSLIFSDAKTECAGCHTDMHNQTVGPDCGRCHTPKSWIVDNITEMHQRSRFPLVGAHYTSDCAGCHKSASLLRFDPLGVQCIDCHRDNYTATTNPNHARAGYSTNCTDCHSMNSFTWGSNIDHSFFPLQLGHAIDCKKCHTSGTFSKLPTECVACHQNDYNTTNNPSHSTATIPTTCADCHTTNPGWKPATFPIHSNYYILAGAHLTIDCSTCHKNNYSNILPKTCYGCHQTNYNQSTNPPHATAQFPTDCETCHTQTAWVPSTFNHDGLYFPIYSGKHNGTWTTCGQCHTNSSNYHEFSCINCHPHDNKTETDNNHSGVSGYAYNSAACYACHPTGGAGGFNHSTSIFPLTGVHTTTPCTQCHITGFAGTPTVCSACHTPSYNQTTNPNHVAINIPNTCATCHTTDPGWKPASFPIHNNYYTLSGAHIATNCVDCHHNNYNTTPNTCVGCHQTNYTQTTNPNHVAINIPNTCATCHTTTPGWKPATFPIHSNYYVLAGAHLTLNCSTCHQSNYNNTLPTLCYGCHQSNYNQTTNPPHASAQFPTDCQTCHTQSAWVPSTFNHDGLYFPIYSGHHNGTWTSCSQCHTNSSNYQEFSCITCHQHNQTDMNNAHSGVPGYTYNSAACYNCHPTGSAGGKKFNSGQMKDPH